MRPYNRKDTFKFDADIKDSIIAKTDDRFFRNFYDLTSGGDKADLILWCMGYNPDNFTRSEILELNSYIINKAKHTNSRDTTPTKGHLINSRHLW